MATTDRQSDIMRLREERGLSAPSIARLLKISPGAVEYQLLRHGGEKRGRPPKVVRDTPEARRIVVRQGKLVVGFNRADDELLLALTEQGLNSTEIGARMSPPRAPNTVRLRLMTLARRQERIDAGAELISAEASRA